MARDEAGEKREASGQESNLVSDYLLILSLTPPLTNISARHGLARPEAVEGERDPSDNLYPTKSWSLRITLNSTLANWWLWDWCGPSPVRYLSIIQSNIESGPRRIQFNIQFKQKFIQKLVQNIQLKILFKKLEKKWFKMPIDINVIFEPLVRACC